jgi:hypothetical protein
MKKLSSAILAIIMSFYGMVAFSPALALADNGNHNGSDQGSGNKSVQEIKHNFSWGAFVSSIRSNSKKFGSFINKNIHHNDNGNKHDKGNGGGVATTTANVATNPATNITSIDATLNGLNGSVAATGHSFWVSLAPFVTTSSTIPSGVYSTPDLGAEAANTAFSTSLSSLTTTGVPSNLPAITPHTKYYFAAWSLVGGTWYPGSVRNFTTSATTTPADTTSPNILFATNIGLNASTTSVIWVTNEASNGKIWFGTTSPVATTTTPMVSSGTLSYFHQLNLPGLATSTLYYYTISSTDASGNTIFYSNSFTAPTI